MSSTSLAETAIGIEHFSPSPPLRGRKTMTAALSARVCSLASVMVRCPNEENRRSHNSVCKTSTWSFGVWK
jgi:hypothetical protein